MVKKDKKKVAAENAENPEAMDAGAEVETVNPALIEAEKTLAEKQKLYEEYLDKYERLFAEFDNFRKRTAKEKSLMYDLGVRDTVTRVLSVVDNLERALSSSSDRENLVYKGVEMTLKNLNQVFSDMEVKAIPAVGEQFDTNLHNAVAHEENEEYGENVITAELQKGYLYKDTVIRHSMVKVAN